MDKKVKKMNEMAKNNKGVAPELLTAAKEITVRPEAVEKAIAEINKGLSEVNEVLELEELSAETKCNHKVTLIKGQLQNALAASQAIKTAGEEARKKWQRGFFPELEPWQSEGKQLNEEKMKDSHLTATSLRWASKVLPFLLFLSPARR